MSCDRHYGIGKYPICSGNGACIDDICYCTTGWTGLTDFETEIGFDCDISTVSIQVMQS